jgi:small subunit ribosomal protein S2
MAMPDFTMRQLLEAGVHFGHSTRRWNPRMGAYLFGVRNGVHIIDLQQTVPMLHAALAAVREVTASGGRVLFVGTKRQASELVADAATRCGQYYVNHRWLGGTLTNWKTITASIRRLRDLDETLDSEEVQGLTKKEQLGLTRERDKLQRALGGIKEMGALPDIMFVIDTNKEAIAVKEANKLNLPVIGVIDSNSDPAGITFPIPGNDDAIRSISLYCELIARSVLDGLQQEAIATGGDIGESEEAPLDDLPAGNGVDEAPEAAAEVVTEAAPEAAAEAVTEAAPEAEAANAGSEEPSQEPSLDEAGESADKQ